MATVTASFAVLVLLLITVLAMNTTRYRFTRARSRDPADSELIRRASRAHGNTLEHGLPVLLLLYFSEIHGANIAVLCVMGTVFVAARLLYVYGMYKQPGGLPMQVGAGATYLIELCLLALLFSRLI